MEKVDGRKLNDSTRVFLKTRAKELRKTGKSYQEIADILGIHLNTVARWLHPKKGASNDSFKRRGRKQGEQRTLSEDQEKEIRELIRDKTPEQLKLPFMLWTRKAIRDLISRRLSITMPIRTVGEYLERWNYTPQRPLKRAYEQRPAEVKAWLEQQYPSIQERAIKEKAEIHWGDETGINNEAQQGRSYAPKGKTPVLHVSAKRFSASMISSVTNQGKVRFMIYKGGMNVAIFIRFLERLIKDSQRKIFLIVDNLRVHHSYALADWLKLNIDHIELFFLPSYSPEKNPDEYLNNDLKKGLSNRPIPRTHREMIGNVVSHMRSLQKLSNHVANFFQHPSVKYAA
jgi:transposase